MEPRTLQYIALATGGELSGAGSARSVTRVCTDSRQAGEGDLFFALCGPRHDGHRFLEEVIGRGVAAVVAERRKLPEGFKGVAILVDDTRRALGRLAASYRREFELPIVAVGGSNGKTTTKELIASVLRQRMATLWSEASFNNDIGIPLTLLRLERMHQAGVLETGTNHPGELAPLLAMVEPKYGVVTNIGGEHLEFFGNLDGVAREEGAMAEALPAKGKLFVNGDDAWTDNLVCRTSAEVVRVGLGPANDCTVTTAQCDEAGAVFHVQHREETVSGAYRIRLLGRHQIVNALFAVAVGAALGLERADIQHGLAACRPVKMRMELVNAGGLRVLNDAYNANADSMFAALETLRELPCQGRRVAVLGDMAELGDGAGAAHAKVGARAAETAVDQLFTVGARAGEIASAARRSGLSNVAAFLEVKEAGQAVKDFARPGDTVLVKASRAMGLERITAILCGKAEAA